MKKNLTISKLMMLIVMAILPFSMFAQKEEGKKKSKPAEKYWYIQADGGLSISHSDLASYNGGIWDDFGHFKTMAFSNFKNSWNAHLGFGYQFSKVVGFNIKGGYGRINGHKHLDKQGNVQYLYLLDADGKTPKIDDPEHPFYSTVHDLGLDMTDYFEGSFNFTFNLFNMFKYNPRRAVNLIPHVGIGGIYYKAGQVNRMNYDPENSATEEVMYTVAQARDKRKLHFNVPVGMELNFNITPKFDLFLDYTYTFTGTDNLDQVCKYNESGHVINDKDMYSQVNLGLRVKFNNPCDIEKMARESKKITYRVNPDPLVEGEDGKVCFDVIVTIPGEYFEKQAVMNLKPYLKYNGGEIDLDPITFVGEKVKGEGDFRVNYKEGGEFTKHYCKDYVPEMENCELMGDPMFYVYDGTIYPTQEEIVKNTYFTQGATEKLADGVIALKKCLPASNLKATVNETSVNVSWTGDADSYEVTLKNGNEVVKTVNVKGHSQSFDNLELGTNYSVVVVAKCTDKDGEAVATSFSTPASVETPADFTYFFPKDSWDINQKSINKSVRASIVERLKEDPEIKGFRVEGWASPEGELERNDKLADNRSSNAKTDIEKQIGKAGK